MGVWCDAQVKTAYDKAVTKTKDAMLKKSKVDEDITELREKAKEQSRCVRAPLILFSLIQRLNQIKMIYLWNDKLSYHMLLMKRFDDKQILFYYSRNYLHYKQDYLFILYIEAFIHDKNKRCRIKASQKYVMQFWKPKHWCALSLAKVLYYVLYCVIGVCFTHEYEQLFCFVFPYIIRSPRNPFHSILMKISW